MRLIALELYGPYSAGCWAVFFRTGLRHDTTYGRPGRYGTIDWVVLGLRIGYVTWGLAQWVVLGPAWPERPDAVWRSLWYAIGGMYCSSWHLTSPTARRGEGDSHHRHGGLRVRCRSDLGEREMGSSNMRGVIVWAMATADRRGRD